MLVVIPHETEVLKLINYQKKLSSELFNKGIISITNYPFWIELPENEIFETDENDDNLKNTIYSVPFVSTVCSVPFVSKLKKISVNFSNLSIISPRLENNQLLLTLQYNYKQQTKTADFPLLSIIQNKNNISVNEISVLLEETLLFPMQIKIFQLAIAKKIPEGKQILQGDSIFVKIGKATAFR